MQRCSLDFVLQQRIIFLPQCSFNVLFLTSSWICRITELQKHAQCAGDSCRTSAGSSKDLHWVSKFCISVCRQAAFSLNPFEAAFDVTASASMPSVYLLVYACCLYITYTFLPTTEILLKIHIIFIFIQVDHLSSASPTLWQATYSMRVHSLGFVALSGFGLLVDAGLIHVDVAVNVDTKQQSSENAKPGQSGKPVRVLEDYQVDLEYEIHSGSLSVSWTLFWGLQSYSNNI